MDLAQFYESINLASVRDFVSTGREEDLYLDFKTSSNPMGRDDRKSFATALSGFANSSGGLVVWGVEARKRAPDELDVAVALQPISNLAKFLTDLNSFTGQFVNPVVDSVQHKRIEVENNEGFVVTFIPESSIGPHMAKAGEDRYYKRSGSSFYRLEHFDLEDMFGRRPKPILNLYVEPGAGAIEWIPIIRAGSKIDLHFGLRNTGRGVARSPYLSITVSPPYELSDYGLDGNGGTGLPQVKLANRTRNQAAFGGTSGTLVYPQVDLGISTIRHRVQIEGQLPQLRIEYALASEEVPLFTAQYILSSEEIIHLLAERNEVS